MKVLSAIKTKFIWQLHLIIARISHDLWNTNGIHTSLIGVNILFEIHFEKNAPILCFIMLWWQVTICDTWLLVTPNYIWHLSTCETWLFVTSHYLQQITICDISLVIYECMWHLTNGTNFGACTFTSPSYFFYRWSSKYYLYQSL